MSLTKGTEFWKLGKKIVAAGLNYKTLLKERNLEIPTEPVIFIKPTSSYITAGQTILIPPKFSVHEEVELGVVISKKCTKVNPHEVVKYIAGYCLALDLTAVNVLKDAKEKGKPWTLGKGFDTACPVSQFLSHEIIPDPGNLRIWCSVNGKVQQDGNTSDMVFTIGELISYISQFITLEPYDLVLTGSPSGTGSILPGDIIEGGLGNSVYFKFPVS